MGLSIAQFIADGPKGFDYSNAPEVTVIGENPEMPVTINQADEVAFSETAAEHDDAMTEPPIAFVECETAPDGYYEGAFDGDDADSTSNITFIGGER